MKNLLVILLLSVATAISGQEFVTVPADQLGIVDENLVGVWTLSQDVANHNLTKAQVSELCGMGLVIIHSNQKTAIHIRINRDGKLLMSMDVISKKTCTSLVLH